MKVSSDKKKRFIKKALLEALQTHLGNVTEACKTVGISRKTYYEYLKNDPDFVSDVSDIEEGNLDLVEGKLLELIQGIAMQGDEGAIYTTQPNVTAAIFYLKTKGKKRGYVEKTEQEVTIRDTQLIAPTLDDDETG